MKLWQVFIAGVCLSFAATAVADHPTHLDLLLSQVKKAKQRDAAIREKRKAGFLAARADRIKLLEAMRQEVAAEKQRGEDLKTAFEENEETLAVLEADLVQRTGDLGELFGAVRQASKDLTGLMQDSFISAQHPSRVEWLEVLGESKKLPDITELERLWLLMQEEIAESGRVARMPATVVETDGVAGEKQVIRVGLFNAISDDRYLNYQPESHRFVVLARQPASSVGALAGTFSTTKEPYSDLALDPTRGVLLGLLVDTPDLMERFHHGGIVGYVILALGALGVLVVVVRLLYLTWVGGHVRSQLKDLSKPSENNPLGRILIASAQSNGSLKNLEFQIDEAIMRETPRLVRGEGLVKLLAGVAPLLGLLGTVVGMIVTFQAISLFGTGDPKLMASGISQALVTTALGLIVAIPLLFLHSLVSSRSRALVQTLEERSAGLVAMSRESAE